MGFTIMESFMDDVEIDSVFGLGTKVIMKKQHPCGTNEWEITRVGADIKIKCLNCGRTVLIPRIEFNKKLKKIISQEG